MRMKLRDFAQMTNRMIGFLVINVNPGKPQPCFRGTFMTGSILQHSFINLHGPVLFLDKRNPGHHDIPMSGKKQVPDLIFTFYNPGKINFIEMFINQALKAVKLLAIQSGFPVCPGGRDQRIAPQDRRFRHEMRIHVPGCRPTVACLFFTGSPL